MGPKLSSLPASVVPAYFAGSEELRHRPPKGLMARDLGFYSHAQVDRIRPLSKPRMSSSYSPYSIYFGLLYALGDSDVGICWQFTTQAFGALLRPTPKFCLRAELVAHHSCPASWVTQVSQVSRLKQT